MSIFTKCIGVFALFHSVTSVLLLAYANYPVDTFMILVLLLEFVIGIACLYASRVLKETN
jgi:hypothetical protein